MKEKNWTPLDGGGASIDGGGYTVRPSLEGEVTFECPSCREAGGFSAVSTEGASRFSSVDRITFTGVRCPGCGKSFTVEATAAPEVP